MKNEFGQHPCRRDLQNSLAPPPHDQETATGRIAASISRGTERVLYLTGEANQLADRLLGAQPESPDQTAHSLINPGTIGQIDRELSLLEAQMARLHDALRRLMVL